jgi:hypothetical protein
MIDSEPPTELTESQKRAVQQKITTEMLHGQMLYSLRQDILPPSVEFVIADPRNAAESACNHAMIERGKPAWRIYVNPALAAQNYHRFMRETIPHEVAHLLLCQIEDGWADHGPRWEMIVRDAGAVPKPYHDYAEAL